MKSLFHVLAIAFAGLVVLSSNAQAQNPLEPTNLPWPKWMKLNVVIRLPDHELIRAQASTNAILIQDFNPYGRTGRGTVGHLDAEGRFTEFEPNVPIKKIEIGALSAFEFHASGLKLSVAENLQVLATTSADRKTLRAIGAARAYTSQPHFTLATPPDESNSTARPNSGPLGQINVAGRFFKTSSILFVGGQRFNVLHFSDYSGYDRGRVTFGTLGPKGEFVPSAIAEDSFRRNGSRTYIGGTATPIFQMWDGETEIFQQLIGGRDDGKVVQSAQVSVLRIADRADIYSLPSPSTPTNPERTPPEPEAPFDFKQFTGRVLCEALFKTSLPPHAYIHGY